MSGGREGFLRDVQLKGTTRDEKPLSRGRRDENEDVMKCMCHEGQEGCGRREPERGNMKKFMQIRSEAHCPVC